jgi:hypothetical protein
MKRWILSLVFLVLLFTVSCSSKSAQSGGDTNNPSDLKYIFEIPSGPYSVTITLDPTIQAESMIPTSGGGVGVTGADGTYYQLDIPDGALLEDTLIRLIPVTAINGMPFGSNPLAVQIEPEGLQLYDFATLTIKPSQDIPIDQQIFFGYQAMGDNLVLAPPVVNSNEMKVQILHFSGYGVTKGFSADIEPVRQRIGGDAEARIQSAVAEQLLKARQSQLLGIGEGSDIDLTDYFSQYEEQVVKPRIAAAGESCAAGKLAIQTVLGLERQRQLLGMSENTDNPLIDSDLMSTVTLVCMKEEYEICRDDHIIHRIVPAWLGVERQYQLLGITENGETGPVLEQVKEYVRMCLTFRLEFHSQGVFNDPDGGGYDSTVDSVIKLQFNTDDMSMHAEAPLVNTAFEFKSPDCNVTSNRGGGTFEAIKLEFIPDTHSPTDTMGYVRDFTLVYDPGSTSESFTVNCGDSGSYTSPPSALWSAIFIPLHHGEVSMTEGGYIADTWEILAGELYAKKEWIKEDSSVNIIETGTFKLYHTPG